MVEILRSAQNDAVFVDYETMMQEKVGKDFILHGVKYRKFETIMVSK